ncbi:O-antigen ligase family protein [Chitinophagales bacterium]|nr:O-antigen ligase family protein [Chitinophagales bacterium]
MQVLRLAKKSNSFSPKLEMLLVCLFLCMEILGFFTLGESIGTTRVLKVILRMLSTAGIAFFVLKQLGNCPKIQFTHSNPLLFYIAYLFLGIISVYWSTLPSYSILQLFMTLESFLFSFLFIIYLVRKTTSTTFTQELARYLHWAIFPITLVFALGYFIAPDQFVRLTHGGAVARLGGYLMNPNEMGMLCGVAIAALICALKNKQVSFLHYWPGLLYMAVLLLTESRSSLIAVVLVLAAVTLQKGNKKQIGMLFLAGCILAPIAFFGIVLKEGDYSEVFSLTGRLPFWTALLTEGFPKSPFFGFGFMRIAWTDAFHSVNSYCAKMTHNTFIQVIMNLGLVGFGIIIVQLTSTIKTALNEKRKGLQLFFALLMIPLLVNSLTEFGIYGESNFGILFFQLLFLAISIDSHKEKYNRDAKLIKL